MSLMNTIMEVSLFYLSFYDKDKIYLIDAVKLEGNYKTITFCFRKSGKKYFIALLLI
jgi:hypothetical protein